jgi:hypothetical protein
VGCLAYLFAKLSQEAEVVGNTLVFLEKFWKYRQDSPSHGDITWNDCHICERSHLYTIIITTGNTTVSATKQKM